MATKALNQLIFDADWGELDFLIIDFPWDWRYSPSIMQKFPVNGSVVSVHRLLQWQMLGRELLCLNKKILISQF